MEQENVNNNSKNSTWLEPLRRHSWEMELLLTGFVLIGLFQIPESLEIMSIKLREAIEGGGVFKALIIVLPINVLLVGVKIMRINLILLLLMRGFWIGMVGLSSAFPKGIHYQNLSFNKRFNEYLRKESIDPEHIIVRLDNICSSIFAISFLIFFITISMGLFVVQFQILNSSMSYFGAMANQKFYYLILTILLAAVLFFYLLSGLLKLIDFLSIGILKKITKKWFAVPYFFMSRFISYVTLAFLYRPVYYYLVSNFPKKAMRLVLSIYIFITVIAFFGFSLNSHKYFPKTYFNEYTIVSKYYENVLDKGKNDYVITSPMIQSDIIHSNYLKLFIPYDVGIHEHIESKFPGIKPISQSLEAEMMDWGYRLDGSDVKQSLEGFKELYTISVDDSICTNIKVFFHKHQNSSEKGIMMYVPINHLGLGYHSLEIKEAGEVTDIIHFWKE